MTPITAARIQRETADAFRRWQQRKGIISTGMDTITMQSAAAGVREREAKERAAALDACTDERAETRRAAKKAVGKRAGQTSGAATAAPGNPTGSSSPRTALPA